MIGMCTWLCEGFQVMCAQLCLSCFFLLFEPPSKNKTCSLLLSYLNKFVPRIQVVITVPFFVTTRADLIFFSKFYLTLVTFSIIFKNKILNYTASFKFVNYRTLLQEIGPIMRCVFAQRTRRSKSLVF